MLRAEKLPRHLSSRYSKEILNEGIYMNFINLSQTSHGCRGNLRTG